MATCPRDPRITRGRGHEAHVIKRKEGHKKHKKDTKIEGKCVIGLICLNFLFVPFLCFLWQNLFSRLFHIFLNLKLLGTEVNQQAMAKAGGFEISVQLSNIRVCRGRNRFQLDNQFTLDDQVKLILR